MVSIMGGAACETSLADPSRSTPVSNPARRVTAIGLPESAVDGPGALAAPLPGRALASTAGTVAVCVGLRAAEATLAAASASRARNAAISASRARNPAKLSVTPPPPELGWAGATGASGECATGERGPTRDSCANCAGAAAECAGSRAAGADCFCEGDGAGC